MTGASPVQVERFRFEHPPVRTVSFGLLFTLSEPLTVAHAAGLIGLWEPQYPDTRELAPPPAPNAPTFGLIADGDPWPFPLLVLENPDGRSVRLHSEALSVGWSFGEDYGENRYPGYAALRPELSKRLDELRDHFVSRGLEMSLSGATCRYGNNVPLYTPAQMVLGYFGGWPSDDPQSPVDDRPTSYVGGRVFHEASIETDGCSIMISFDPASEDAPEGTRSSMDIEVRREGGGDSVTLDDLDIVHGQLTKTFGTVSNPTLRAIWGEIHDV